MGRTATPTSAFAFAILYAITFALQVFRATGLITPVELAARYLEDFYDIIALKVETGFWGSVPPMHNLVLKRWNYELTFFCYAAPIPWEFIQEVALEMSSWAERGFTAEFDALYMAVDNLGKEIFVSVVMKLVQAGSQLSKLYRTYGLAVHEIVYSDVPTGYTYPQSTVKPLNNKSSVRTEARKNEADS
ncbi:hypothetical protein G7Y79_00011g031370 [Physcia stellaris]|nr:hypothetical protein G7Y79_00011g031370 [Physcia stellaris]